MDERQKSIHLTSMALTVMVVYVFLIVECFVKYISTGDILECRWEIVLLVLMSLVWIVSSRRDESVFLAKTLSGEVIDDELGSRGRKKRVKYYLREAVIFTVAMILISSIMSLITGTRFDEIAVIKGMNVKSSYILTGTINVVLLFVTSFLIDFVTCEFYIKKYNKKLEELEDKDE